MHLISNYMGLLVINCDLNGIRLSLVTIDSKICVTLNYYLRGTAVEQVMLCMHIPCFANTLNYTRNVYLSVKSKRHMYIIKCHKVDT